MSPTTPIAIACTMALYILVALCAMWAWKNHDAWLAVPLTIIFLVATVAVMWVFDRWGT